MVSYGLSLSLTIYNWEVLFFFFLSWFSVLVLILVLFLIASFSVAFWIKCSGLNVFYIFLVNLVSWVCTSESWGILPVVNLPEWDSGIQVAQWVWLLKLECFLLFSLCSLGSSKLQAAFQRMTTGLNGLFLLAYGSCAWKEPSVGMGSLDTAGSWSHEWQKNNGSYWHLSSNNCQGSLFYKMF